MIRSKIFYKSMLGVSGVILIYTVALLLVVLPTVENATRNLEEKNSKEVLSKVVLLAHDMQKNLDNFQKISLQYHKTELKDLTDTFWSIVEAKYEQSRPENIGTILKQRGEEMQKSLLRFYRANKDRMSEEELKQAVIDYVNIFRYDDGTGYFFIHKGTTVVVHPLYSDFTGRDFKTIQDPNGVYFVREFYDKCKKNGAGTVYYRWKHAETGAFEDKVAYVFTFKPFNWIIGTSGSIRELQKKIKQDVIFLADKIRYGDNNYFFITDYDYKVIAHPRFKQGSDFSSIRDIHGKLIVPSLTAVARKNGEGFTRYWWKKNPDSPEISEKLSFAKDFPEWQMIIGTGAYIDDIQQETEKQKKELLDQLRNIVQETRIGKSGYLYILDGNGTIVIHPNKALEGRDAGKINIPGSRQTIFQAVVRAAETGEPMRYKWDRPDDPGHYVHDKISWVKYIPGLNLYIASSAYTEELLKTSRELQHGILLLGLLILLLAFVVSFLFFRRLFKPISSLTEVANRVTGGDYSARAEVTSKDEIGVLAGEFNTMVDTIEDNIHHLDRKVAEKTAEIEKQNRFFETLFYESSDGILLIRDGLFVDCNRAAFQMLNYKNKEELLSLHPSAISPKLQPDGRPSEEKADEMIQMALDNGSNRFEWVHLHKDGTETFFEVVLTRVVIHDELLIHVVWRDINAKKAAETRLQKTISEFEAVMDNIDYGILFMDDALRVRIANEAFRRLWKMPRDFVSAHPTMRELMEFNRANNLYPVADEDFDRYMDQREADVRKGTIAPVIIKRRDGMILQYQCIVLPDGWRMLTYFDITELKSTQDRLARAQKMEAIGMMAGGVAHDLNNILSGIVGYPELMMMQIPRDSPLRKPLEAIHESGRRAATVVADLLTIARSAACAKKPHDLNVLIREYLHSPEYEKLRSLHPHVHCRHDLAAENAVISCSPVHIKKAVMNLVTNAVEAVDTNGQILMTTTNLTVPSGATAPDNLAPGRYVVITVEDNGPGISENDLAHIFEPFYSRKIMGRSGTGLGLTVVWNTVEDHGGKVTVKSSERGTCFTLYFPVISDQLPAVPEQETLQQQTGHGQHILIVDDEPQLRDIAGQMLTSCGYRVSTASSGEEAVAFTRDNPVDLLIIDMLMEPGINGRRTYEQILEHRPGQKALIASGFSENEDIKIALQLGAAGFIKKPYSLEQLVNAVREALQQK